MHFVFLSVTTVCEFTLQIKSKQTEKCNCAFSAYFQCEMNTNISLPSNNVKNWSLKTLSMSVVHLLDPVFHSSSPCFKSNFNSQRKKNGKRKKKSVEAVKSVENVNINLPPLILLQKSEISLIFFPLQLSICGEFKNQFVFLFVGLFTNQSVFLIKKEVYGRIDFTSQNCVGGQF